MKDDQIRACFAFDDTDLLANRNGELSEKQSQRIREADRFAERFIFILFFVFLVSGIFVGVLAIYVRNNTGLWIGTVILLLLAAWLFRGLHTEVDDTIQKANPFRRTNVKGNLAIIAAKENKMTKIVGLQDIKSGGQLQQEIQNEN